MTEHERNHIAFRSSKLRTMRIDCLILALCIAFLNPFHAAAVEIETVLIGNPGNPADTAVMIDEGSTGYGAVPYEYRIGKYEVTNAQYVEFLNAVARDGGQSLYVSQMTNEPRGGILRTGVAGSYAYSVKPNYGNRPVAMATFESALRFANWMHNGQPTGRRDATTTEDGAYTLTSLTSVQQKRLRHNPGAKWFLPSEDEWYKAAYYQPAMVGGDADGYWLFATRSNVDPGRALANSIGQVTNPGANVANYGKGQDGIVMDVGGAGPLSASFYGTFDQTGNLSEWIEGGNSSAIDQINIFRGGNWDQLFIHFDPATFEVTYVPAEDVSSVRRGKTGHNSPQIGFRLAALPVPEPATAATTAFGLLALAAARRRCAE